MLPGDPPRGTAGVFGRSVEDLPYTPGEVLLETQACLFALEAQCRHLVVPQRDGDRRHGRHPSGRRQDPGCLSLPPAPADGGGTAAVAIMAAAARMNLDP
ncbi:unannotated protein [freshwater metagenome]|uniref:Unannotated protein n=1 Tax=freshwater metagenome TaxID=449393 RepID=A0A6J7LB24_9ZZZZ